MGLDISAWEFATVLPEHPVGDSCWERTTPEGAWDDSFVPHVHVWKSAFDAFPQSSRGLERERCYEVSGESIGFRAGSYSGYSEWRGMLARFGMGTDPRWVWSEPETFKDTPFFELVNFSDCEGSIGPEACADLSVDFETMRDEILNSRSWPRPEDWDWFVDLYDTWASAFALAANTGLVEFH
jgi:hypothetical protein